MAIRYFRLSTIGLGTLFAVHSNIRKLLSMNLLYQSMQGKLALRRQVHGLRFSLYLPPLEALPTGVPHPKEWRDDHPQVGHGVPELCYVGGHLAKETVWFTTSKAIRNVML